MCPNAVGSHHLAYLTCLPHRFTSSPSKWHLFEATTPTFLFVSPSEINAARNPSTSWAQANCLNPPLGHQAPSFCQFPGFNSTNSNPAFYYTTSTDAITFEFTGYWGGAFDLLAGLSSPQEDCSLTFWTVNATSDFSDDSTLPLNSQETSLNGVPLKDPQCDNARTCYIEFSLNTGQSCNISSANPFFLGGISIPFNFTNEIEVCDQAIEFGPSPLSWTPQSSQLSLRPMDCSPGHSSSAHSTTENEAFATVRFNGTAIAVFGNVQNDTTYVVTVDGVSTGSLRLGADVGPPGTLFFVSGLDPDTSHQLDISNAPLPVNSSRLTLTTLSVTSFRIFGDFANSGGHPSMSPPNPSSPTASIPNSSPTATSVPGKARIPAPAVAGAVIGSVIGLVLVLIGVLIIQRRRRERLKQESLILVQDRLYIPRSGPEAYSRQVPEEKANPPATTLVTEGQIANSGSNIELLQEVTSRPVSGVGVGNNLVPDSIAGGVAESEESEDHTRARLFAVEQAVRMIMSQAAPPSYASEPDRRSDYQVTS